MNKQIPIKEMKQAAPLALNRVRFKCGSWLRWLFLFCLFMGIGWQAKAEDFEPKYLDANKSKGTNHLQDGYIEVVIPVYQSAGSDEGVLDAWLWVKAEDEGDYKKAFCVNTMKDIDEWQDKNDPTTHVQVRVEYHNDYASGYPYVWNNDNDGEWLSIREIVESNNKYEFYLPQEPVGSFYVTNARFRWYIPSEYAGKKITWKVTMKADQNNDGKNVIESTKSDETFTGGNYPTPTLSHSLSQTPGNYDVRYSIGAFSQEGSYFKWNEDNNTYSTEETGTKAFPISNSSQDVSFTYFYKIHDMGLEDNKSVFAERKAEATLPPFRYPEKLEIEDTENGNTRIKWTVPANGGTDFGAGQFEVQRSTDPGFADNVKTVGYVTYDTGELHLDDKTGEDNLNGTVYYRLRRTHAALWEWNYVVTAQTEKTMYHQGIASATAELAEGRYVKVSWKQEAKNEENKNKMVATEGTQVVLLRTDHTNGGTTKEIEVSEKEAEGGTYTDNSVQLCNAYSYEVFVRPGNKNYDDTKKVQATVTGTNNDQLVPTVLGAATNLVASKGYYSGYTRLEWKVEDENLPIGEFLIERRRVDAQENDNWETVARVESNVRLYDDEKGNPGNIYVYRVRATDLCNGKELFQTEGDETVNNEDRGFRSPTGTISGQITFGNGDAVAGAEVLLSTESSALAGQSLQFKGSDDSYMETMNEMNIPGDATVQLYVKPTKDSQTVTLLSWGRYAVGIQGGKAAVCANNGTAWHTAEAILPIGKFTQLTAVFDTDRTLYLYADSVKVMEVAATGNVNASTTAAKVTVGKGFTGYIDEIRLWTRALSKGTDGQTADEIGQTFNRLLTGNEKGLAAYWRLSEPLTDETYDISYHEETYHKNHAALHDIELGKDTEEYPTAGQLSPRGLTDTGGNFRITGVPYIGTGTTYSVTPSYPNHKFDPATREVTLSDQTPAQDNIDFKNNSAITVSGHVFYENSSIPVKDATFKVDGQPVLGGDGQLAKSGADGSFNISVPVGKRTVVVEKPNHTFKNGGHLWDSNGSNIDYNQPLTDIRFWDQTRVKLIGRVAGGTVEENKPLGFSLSKNNLGDNLTLKLVLEGENGSEIYDKDVAGEGAEESMEQEWTHHDGEHKNKVVFNQYDITITPNNKTGEFEAMLFPLNYKLSEATATGWDKLIGNSAPTIDLSNAFVEQTSEYTPVDEEGNELATETVSYNGEFKLIHRVNPTISYKQANRAGKTMDYFGYESYAIADIHGGKPDSVKLYNADTKKYLFEVPVFAVGAWNFFVEATEDYHYNGVKEGNDVKVDRVPTQKGKLSISNTFKEINSTQEEELDETGKKLVTVVMDKPIFANNDKGKLTFSVEIDGQTYETAPLEGYLIGRDPKTDGMDFVTAGPKRLLNILRDPPGSTSYSWWESGQTISYYSMSGKGFTQVGSEEAGILLGTTTENGIGFGVMTFFKTESDNDVTISSEHETVESHPEARTMTVTTNTRYQTSDDPLNVGSAADVFIGISNNIYYGAVDYIDILDQEAFEQSYKGTDTMEKYTKVTTEDGKSYYICRRKILSSTVQGATNFAYPKMHIENILIPNLVKLRNELLHVKTSTFGEAEAKAMAKRENRTVYLSYLPADDENFGAPNSEKLKSYEVFFPNGKPQEEVVVDDPVYDMFPEYFEDEDKKLKNGTPDSVDFYNRSINEWIKVLKKNEDEKLKAFKENDLINYSFGAASPVEYSEAYSVVKEDGYTYEYVATAGVAANIGFTINGLGFSTAVSEQFGESGEYEQNEGEENTAASGYVLSDEGDFDYISVDMFRAAPTDSKFKDKWEDMLEDIDEDDVEQEPDKIKEKQYGSFIFRTRGGATACPYEPAEYTQYQDGAQQLLNAATQQIERPDITVDKPVVTNVPSDQAAIYNLKLMNNSQVSGATAIFTLAIVDAQNQKGAKFSVDGVPLADGRGIEVPYGEVLNKVLEVRRGTEYDYENLAVVLKSQCQSDPTDNQADIADTVYISAHFIPSSSDINIKSPTDKWTLNTNAPLDSATGKYYMPLTIDGFDVNFQDFHHIEVQYKASSEADTRWTNICSFFKDTVLYEAASGTKAYITGPTLTTRFFGAEDQNYDIRAVSFSKVGNEFVTKESPVISGVKDTKRPVVFGNIEPADGVLGVEDEIRLTFNEPIAEGYMTDVKNFRVTGVRNGSNGDHSTAITFDGRTSYLETQVTRNLEAKDVTVEMWINPASRGQDMTLFSHGDATNALELTLAKDNTLKVRIGESEYASKTLNVRTDEWQHVALSYRAANQQLSVYFGGQEVVTGVQTVPYNGVGPMNFGRSLSGKNYFAGQMHEARVWTKVVEMTDIIANALRIYTGREAGLTAYYPMKEGKGDMVTDKAQGATAYMYGATWSTQDGKSIEFNGDNALMVVNTSRVALKSTSDYTLEFWFKAAPGQKDATLVANGKGVGEENNGNADKVFVGFADGELVFRNNGQEQKVAGNFADGAWHHFVLTVNRTAGNAQIFMDGVLNSYFDATKVGGFSATELYAGARRWTEAEQMVSHTDMYLDGAIDELRIWNMALPASTITNNYNVSPEGTEMGLMMYLPFSKYITNSANIQELVYSAEDLVTDSMLVTLENAKATSEVAPVCKKAPETSIPFTFVVNNDALVINLMDTPEAIEKTTVNFTVKDVSDLNGNLMESPVTWSAYIDRNQLKWSEKQITKEKKLNATMTFAVDVENHGGTVKNFKIEGLPAWLDAMPESGTIDPQGRETILFTVDEGTNVGRYDEVVYVKGDNNVAEALPITLKVFDEQPDWTVNPGDFKYNMNIYGRVRFNKQFSADAEDMLATFDASGRCIGVANSQYLKDNDMWYVFMTVYSNTNRLSADQIEFRSWDASTGLVYTAYPTVEISFESDKVWGTATAPIVFDGEERVVQNIDLIPGWNWISYNVANELFSDPASILSKAIFNGDEQVKDETNGLYMTYDGARKQWVNNDPNRSLKFDNRHMFLLQSPTVQKLSVSGMTIHEKENLTLNILPNWNYISYLSTVNLPISEALAGFEAAEGDIIKSQDRFSMYGETTGWLGSLTYLEPGKGYMLFSKNKTSLTYPDVTAGTTTRSGDIRTRTAAIPAEEPVSELAGRYVANMSVVATVADNMPLHSGDRLLAYANGELRGEALVTERPSDGESLFFLNVGGDRNEGISFALERSGEIIAETSPMLDYAANSVRGNIEQPMIIDFVNDLEISVYPNPFEHELNFILNAQAGDKVEIMLYTMAGQLFHHYQTTAAYNGYIQHRYEAMMDMSKGVYMAVVVVNGKRHVYKVTKR